MYIALKLNLTTNLIMKTFVVMEGIEPSFQKLIKFPAIPLSHMTLFLLAEYKLSYIVQG